MMLFFKFNFIRRKKRNLRNMYTTCKQQRTAKYTYNNTQRSRKRCPKKRKEKKKRLHIVHTDNGTEESFTFRLKSILILDEGNAVTSS